MPWPALTPLAAAVLHVGAPERILEIECGDAEGTFFLAREFPGARVRGVDRSEQAVRRVGERIGLDPEGRLAFKVAGPGDLPFPDDQFDLLAAVDAVPVAAETARVLRHGGCLVLVSSRCQSPLPGLRGRFARWRLAHAGLEPFLAESAGEGSFSILRRGADDAAPSSV